MLLVKVLNCVFVFESYVSENSFIHCVYQTDVNTEIFYSRQHNILYAKCTILWWFGGGKKWAKSHQNSRISMFFIHVLTRFIGSYWLAKINLFITCRHFVWVCVSVSECTNLECLAGSIVAAAVASIENDSSWLLLKLSSESSLSFISILRLLAEPHVP